MSANPSVIGGARRNVTPQLSGDRLATTQKWRTGQGVLLVLVALVAVYYWMVGWQSPGSNGSDVRTLPDLAGFGVLAAMILLATPTTGTIALTTFHEAIRRKWMTALLGFAVIILVLSTFFQWMQGGTEKQFLRDFGLGFITIIMLTMAIFLGVALVPPDIERRTIFTILAKPVNRLEFLLGKFLGLCLTLMMNLALMSVAFLLAFMMFSLRRSNTVSDLGLGFELMNLGRALALQYGSLMVMAALALTLSLLLSNIAAIVVSFIVYFLGQASSYWEHLSQGDGAARLPGWVEVLVKGAYAVLPRLDRFDVRERLVNEAPIAFNYMWKSFGSGLVYVAALLTIAYFTFSDREF